MTNFSLFGIGPLELIFVLIIALVVLGPERLPQVARQLARGWIQIRQLSSDLTSQLSEEFGDLDELKQITQELQSLNPEKLAESLLAEEEKEEEKEQVADAEEDKKAKEKAKAEDVKTENDETTEDVDTETDKKVDEELQAEELATAELKAEGDAITDEADMDGEEPADEDNGIVSEDVAASEIALSAEAVAEAEGSTAAKDLSTPSSNSQPSADTALADGSSDDETPGRPVIDMARITPPAMHNAVAAVSGKGISPPPSAQEPESLSAPEPMDSTSDEAADVTGGTTADPDPMDSADQVQALNGADSSEPQGDETETEAATDTNPLVNEIPADEISSSADPALADDISPEPMNTIAPPELQASTAGVDEHNPVAVDSSEETP